jgi:hypothetical protein
MKNSIAIGNWKSLLGFCLALFAGLFISSCSDDDYDVPPDTTTSRTPYVCTTCASTSQALPENDNIAKGIYKGVFPNGTIAVNFRNENETSNAVIYYKNRTVNLSESPVLIEFGDGDGERPSFTLFRGMYENNPVSLSFAVNEDGTNPEVLELIIGGSRSPLATLFKEKSNTLIEDYEGNYFLSRNVSPSGGLGGIPVEEDNPEGDFESGRVDPGLVLPSSNAGIVGSARLVLSRSEGMWTLVTTMNNTESVMDSGSIESGSLMSAASGKRVAYLRNDEINFSENTSSGVLSLHAERKR